MSRKGNCSRHRPHTKASSASLKTELLCPPPGSEGTRAEAEARDLARVHPGSSATGSAGTSRPSRQRPPRHWPALRPSTRMDLMSTAAATAYRRKPIWSGPQGQRALEPVAATRIKMVRHNRFATRRLITVPRIHHDGAAQGAPAVDAELLLHIQRRARSSAFSAPFPARGEARDAPLMKVLTAPAGSRHRDVPHCTDLSLKPVNSRGAIHGTALRTHRLHRSGQDRLSAATASSSRSGRISCCYA